MALKIKTTPKLACNTSIIIYLNIKKYVNKMDSETEAEFWKHTEEIMAKLKIDDELEEEKTKQKYNKEYAREYYKQNREMISARSRAYYQSHKEVMKKNNYAYMFKKITCECGIEMIYGSKYRHMKSKIHFKNLKKIARR